MHFIENSDRELGVIPDVYCILGKCSLKQASEKFMESGTWFEYYDWKRRMCQNQINFSK